MFYIIGSLLIGFFVVKGLISDGEMGGCSGCLLILLILFLFVLVIGVSLLGAVGGMFA